LAAALPRMTPALAEARAPRRVMVWNFIVVDDLVVVLCWWMLLMALESWNYNYDLTERITLTMNHYALLQPFRPKKNALAASNFWY
jgi:hypothetical protein